MKIAIIGAGISGLVAGRELNKAGHDVNIFEKSRGYGGRMATRYAEDDKSLKLDHGVSYFSVDSDEFSLLVKELSEVNILEKCRGNFKKRGCNGDLKKNNIRSKTYFAPDGMNSIGKFLARDLKSQLNQRVISLTHAQNSKWRKRKWILECESGITKTADAIVISTPAPQAVELLKTVEKGTDISSLIQDLEEVTYDPKFTLMLTYSHKELQDWVTMEVEDKVIKFISNESKKRDLRKDAIVVHSSSEFASKYIGKDRDAIADIIQEQLSAILGKWTESPDWKQLHFWRYSQTRDPLPYDFMETSGNGTPLALVGSYMKGNSVESAYLSGLNLGRHWALQLSEKE